MIKEHLALRLYQIQNQKMSVKECSERYCLSGREAEVLQYLTKNLSMEEIAQALSISIHTLHKHASHIYQKMNISGRIELFDLVHIDN
jgi:DNA-binding CsgD family transcriptional regulator